MVKTCYSFVDVEIPQMSEIDLTLMSNKVHFYNGPDRHLFFDSIPNPDTLRFIHIYKEDLEYKELSVELSEVSNLFECKLTSYPIVAEDMAPEVLSAITMAKQLMFSNRYFGESRSIWGTTNKTQVLNEVDDWIGFTEFKAFFKELTCYCENIKGSGIKGNYNLVLVNDHGFDIKVFVEAVFSLYSSMGIIKDSCIILGDLGDAVLTEKNTSFLYQIAREWAFDDEESIFSNISNEAASFQKLIKREAIYITTMSKAQFKIAQKNK